MLSDKSAGERSSLNHTEFAQLEYDLQLTLHSSTVRVVASYAISNPHVSGQFERRSKASDILVLPAWIDSSAFGGINTEEDVVRRGFRLPPPSQGLRFTVGRIDSAVSTDVGGDTLISASTTPGKTLRKAMLCLVAVGRSFVADETMAENEPIPVGYDSFHIQDPTLLADAQPKQKAYEHTYFIKILLRRAQMYLETVVTTQKSRSSSSAPCVMFLYVFCKMVGNHANGEAARHQLVSVTEAYHSVLQEAQVVSLPTPYFNRRTEITNQISAVNSRARSVEKMGSQIEQQVEEMYQRAMRELKLIIQSKLTILLGDELELRRQIGEIDRLEEFLKYQQFGDATTYLFSWSRHQNFRAALHDFKYFQNEIDVQLDAKGMIGGRVLGMGVSHKLQAQNHQRRVQRRTSDFFAEALGSFDQVHIGQGSTLDEDDMDHMSGVYRHD
ncbi:hypothetical protein BSLG_004999 [Batrachochytrium salamandrivorans]|nr:hypothetical protein BSLG_004999 [Batrachochytrium salamandrivorans]